MQRCGASIVLTVSFLALGTGCGLSARKPYARDPVVQQTKPVPGGSGVLATATPVEPTPPPRPILPPVNPAVRQFNPGKPIAPPIDPVEVSSSFAEGPALPVPALPIPAAILVKPVEQPTTVSGALPLPELMPATLMDVPTRSAAMLAPPVRDFSALPGKYAFDADYRRLKGVIDCSQRGTTYLRYRDPTEDDCWGGKVRLEPNAETKSLRDGQLVEVSGELIPSNSVDAAERYPSYHVQTLRRLETFRSP